MFDDNGVAYSRQNGIVVESPAKNLSRLHARSEQKHFDLVFNLYYIRSCLERFSILGQQTAGHVEKWQIKNSVLKPNKD
jgi:hypothetical protein